MTSQPPETGLVHKTHQYISNSPTPEAHTLETWTPPTPPSASTPKYWIIYIHGGAWWRPMIDSSSFTLTARSLLSSPSVPHVAGLASLNSGSPDRNRVPHDTIHWYCDLISPNVFMRDSD